MMSVGIRSAMMEKCNEERAKMQTLQRVLRGPQCNISFKWPVATRSNADWMIPPTRWDARCTRGGSNLTSDSEQRQPYH